MKVKEFLMALKEAWVENEEIHSDIERANDTLRRAKNSNEPMPSANEVDTAVVDYDFVVDNCSAQALLLMPLWLRLIVTGIIGLASSIISFVLWYQICYLLDDILVSVVESWPSPVWPVAFVIIWLALAAVVAVGLYKLSTWLCRVVARSRMQCLQSYSVG